MTKLFSKNILALRDQITELPSIRPFMVFSGVSVCVHPSLRQLFRPSVRQSFRTSHVFSRSTVVGPLNKHSTNKGCEHLPPRDWARLIYLMSAWNIDACLPACLSVGMRTEVSAQFVVSNHKCEIFAQYTSHWRPMEGSEPDNLPSRQYGDFFFSFTSILLWSVFASNPRKFVT